MILRPHHALLLGLASSTGCLVEYDVSGGAQGGTDGMTGGDGGSECSQAHQIRCGGRCVDPQFDPDHCGGCGEACPGAQACHQGSCTGTCDDSLVLCGQACVDPSSNPQHCGECGESCDPGASCVDGECGDGCEPDCAETQTCVAGTCECRLGLTLCGARCIDLASDPNHCGSCVNDCGDASCIEGQCTAGGCGELEQCGQTCVDVENDPLNCRECGETCEGDELCTEEGCKRYRPAGCSSCPCESGCEGWDCCELDAGVFCVDANECPEQ